MGYPRPRQDRYPGRLLAAVGLGILAAGAVAKPFIVTFSGARGPIIIKAAGGGRNLDASLPGFRFLGTGTPRQPVSYTDAGSSISFTAGREVRGAYAPIKNSRLMRIYPTTATGGVIFKREGGDRDATVTAPTATITSEGQTYVVETQGGTRIQANATPQRRALDATGQTGEAEFLTEPSKRATPNQPPTSALEDVVRATLVGNVRVTLRQAAIPNLQEAGQYVATGDRLVLGPRGERRTLTLSGNVNVVATAAESGTVSGATRLVLTLNRAGEVISEEVFGDEQAGTPMVTRYKLKKGGKNR